MKLTTTLVIQTNEEDYAKHLLNYKCCHIMVITEKEEKCLKQALSNIDKIRICNAKHPEKFVTKTITDISFMDISDYNLIRILIVSW